MCMVVTQSLSLCRTASSNYANRCRCVYHASYLSSEQQPEQTFWKRLAALLGCRQLLLHTFKGVRLKHGGWSSDLSISLLDCLSWHCS